MTDGPAEGAGVLHQLLLIRLQRGVASCFSGAADPAEAAPKAKAKAKGKAKAKSQSAIKNKKDKQGNPIAIWELRKVKPSELNDPFPIVCRAETKRAAEREILAKAGRASN